MMKTQITNLVSKILDVNQDDIEIQVPSNVEFGDFSIPCFAFAKVLRMSPKDIAQKLVDNFQFQYIIAAPIGKILSGVFYEVYKIFKHVFILIFYFNWNGKSSWNGIGI